MTKHRLVGMQRREKYKEILDVSSEGPSSGSYSRELKHVGRQHDDDGNQYNESMKRNK
jgi:hypothetical protein